MEEMLLPFIRIYTQNAQGAWIVPQWLTDACVHLRKTLKLFAFFLRTSAYICVHLRTSADQ